MQPPPTSAARLLRPPVIVLFAIFFLLASAAAYSRPAAAILVLDGSVAAAILLAGTGLGLWLVRFIVGDRWSVAEQVVVGACLGAGVLSLLVLALGSCGVISRGVWVTLVVSFIAAGCIRCRSFSKSIGPRRAANDEHAALHGLWLFALPFLFLALLAACVPPGILWPAEGNGYDVLEYHLAAPKEFLLRGRIEFLPHNIYANLPFSAEMLFLLGMILRGRPLDALYSAQLLHVGLGILAVAATWLAARPFGRAAGIVAGLTVACCPIVAYFSGLAYVENGLLALTAAALACLARITRPNGNALRQAAVGGLCIGLACGFKATAAPMIGVPLVLGLLLAPRRPFRARVTPAFVAGLAATAAFSPWLIKNYSATGNPFFPLARGLFPERPGVWSDELAARWYEGHLPAPLQRSASGRLSALSNEVLYTPLYGLLPWLPLLALLPRGRRRDAPRLDDTRAAANDDETNFTMRLCLMLLAGVLAVWLTQTHLVGRFAMPLIVPAAVLTGIAAARAAAGSVRVLIVLMLTGAWSVALAALIATFDQGYFFKLPELGQTGWITRGEWPAYNYLARVNPLLAAGHKVLLIGEARTLYLEGRPPQFDYRVVFNRGPFAEAAAARSPEELLAWLRTQGFDYVFVHWDEMRRLRNSRYGFWPGVDERLFARLVTAGMLPAEEFRYDESSRAPYATLYSVP